MLHTCAIKNELKGLACDKSALAINKKTTNPLAKHPQRSRAYRCNAREWLACAPRLSLATLRCFRDSSLCASSPCLQCGSFARWSNCSTNCQVQLFPSACFLMSSAIIFAISSLFSRMMLIVRSCLRNSAFFHAFSLTEINSQNIQ